MNILAIVVIILLFAILLCVAFRKPNKANNVQSIKKLGGNESYYFNRNIPPQRLRSYMNETSSSIPINIKNAPASINNKKTFISNPITNSIKGKGISEPEQVEYNKITDLNKVISVANAMYNNNYDDEYSDDEYSDDEYSDGYETRSIDEADSDGYFESQNLR